ncbi:MAG: DcaP family trimeric outer membrane transporter [Cyclobacteriaceae bacterium]
MSSISVAQDETEQDSTFVELEYDEPVDKTEEQDTNFVQIDYGRPQDEGQQQDTLSQYQDIVPLDIASDRGLFILSPDRMMQMRILGSVRTLMNYGDQDMPERLTFNPYEIPMRSRSQTPNFYADLSLTRLGFEVTRRTRKMGDLFIRIETDFAGSNGFRIRHAYGQLGSLLIGQTWTLFSNGNYVPATVSRDGAAGSSVFFTPQIRYSHAINNNLSWQASIEYSTTDIDLPDSVNARLVQVIPDVIGRLNYRKDKLSFHVAALVTTISGTDTTDVVSYSFGGGTSIAGMYEFSKTNSLHFSFTSTYAASRFMDLFSGKNEDIAYNPQEQTFAGLFATGGFIAWSHVWPRNFSSTISAGYATISNRYFQEDQAYSYSYNALFNVFWQPVDGARLGIEYASGERWNKNGERGRATRLSILMYYDF